MFLLFRKACLLHKTSKMVSSRLIFTIYHMGIQGVTRVAGANKGLQGVKRGYKGLQGVTWGDKELQGVTGDYKGL